MSEDAAALARRIVQEVLDRRRDEPGAPPPQGAAWTEAGPLPEADVPSATSAEAYGVGRHPPTHRRSTPTSEAGRIARRIVDEVVATRPAPEIIISLEADPEPEVEVEIHERVERVAEHASVAAPPGPAVDVASSPVEAPPEIGGPTVGEAVPADPDADEDPVLEGWALPEEVGDDADADAELPPEEDPRRVTLRWLLMSLLGALALAVLFPLAVGALRSLVAMG